MEGNGPPGGQPSPLGRISIFGGKASLDDSLHPTQVGKTGPGFLGGRNFHGKCDGYIGRVARCFCVMAWRSMGSENPGLVTPLAHDETCVVMISCDPFHRL